MDNPFDCIFFRIYILLMLIINFSHPLPSQLGTPYQDQTASTQKPKIGRLKYYKKSKLVCPSICINLNLVWRQEVEVCWRVGYDVSLVWRLGRTGLVTEPEARERDKWHDTPGYFLKGLSATEEIDVHTNILLSSKLLEDEVLRGSELMTLWARCPINML